MNTTTTILQDIESFLYTPYGLGTIAGLSILCTSFVCLISCCCIVCCYWKYHQGESRSNGIIEAGNDLKYIHHGTRVISSHAPTSSDTNTLNYSTSSLQHHDLLATNLSMDSI